jgi:hypothetical protein
MYTKAVGSGLKSEITLASALNIGRGLTKKIKNRVRLQAKVSSYKLQAGWARP